MFIFKRGNSLKNVQYSTKKKKPKSLEPLKIAQKKKKAQVKMPINNEVMAIEETVATKKNNKKIEKNKEEENI